MVVTCGIHGIKNQSVHIKNLKELKSWICSLVCALGSRWGENSRVCILLIGPMGVGKTQFVKYFVGALGGEREDSGGEGVCSPTFAIHNSYLVKVNGTKEQSTKVSGTKASDESSCSASAMSAPEISVKEVPAPESSIPEISVDHIDLYRLEDEDDLESTGFWDIFEKKQGYIMVEWADRIEESFLPGHWDMIRISMAVHGDGGRTLLVTAHR